MLVFVNSVCGCAAGNARPALRLALAHAVRPQQVVTVFAGQDVEAAARARQYFGEYQPSSPSMALLRDGEVVHFVHRHQIEGRSPQAIAGRPDRGVRSQVRRSRDPRASRRSGQMTATVFHPGHHELHGITVVVETTGARPTSAGSTRGRARSASARRRSARRDPGAEDPRKSTFERSAKFGIRAEHKHLVVPSSLRSPRLTRTGRDSGRNSRLVRPHMPDQVYDVIVIGGGHAGAEAARWLPAAALARCCSPRTSKPLVRCPAILRSAGLPRARSCARWMRWVESWGARRIWPGFSSGC